MTLIKKIQIHVKGEAFGCLTLNFCIPTYLWNFFSASWKKNMWEKIFKFLCIILFTTTHRISKKYNIKNYSNALTLFNKNYWFLINSTIYFLILDIVHVKVRLHKNICCCDRLLTAYATTRRALSHLLAYYYTIIPWNLPYRRSNFEQFEYFLSHFFFNSR